MLGIIAAFGTLFCWTIGTFAFTTASQRTSPGTVNRVRLLFATILLSIITMLMSRIGITELFMLPSLWEWIWLGLSGIIGLTIGDHFAFYGFKLLGSSRASLFNTFAPGAALLLGIVMLGETLSIVGIIGMTISVGGIIWFTHITRKRQAHLVTEIDQKTLTSAIIYAILGAVCQGLGLVCAKKGLLAEQDVNDLNAVHATWIRMLVATVTIIAAGMFKTNVWKEIKSITLTPAYLKPVLTGTIFGPVMGVSLSLFAASMIEVSLAQTIFSLLPISVMLTAVITGKEKVEATSFIAALISVAGVFILVWRDRF